jgi:hypothetical protein
MVDLVREPAEWPERVDADLIDQDERAMTAASRPYSVDDREADMAARRYESWLETLKDHGP